MVSEVAISAGFAALVQGIQAIVALARLAGVSDADMDDILAEQRAKFASKPASALPDA